MRYLEKNIKVEEIKVGDWVMVRPGERIPVDGVIIFGETSIDESMISGEPLPVDKKKGHWVIAGTINRQGVIVFEARKVGKETLLAQIIHLVKKAQASKPPIQRLADVIASYFVPIIFLLSTISFIFWFFKGGITSALLNSISVLIIACPCALGLATPTAIMAGIGQGAKKGILIKDASVFEILPKAKTIVFDKTGTITEAKMEVEDILINSKIKNFNQLSLTQKEDLRKNLMIFSGSLEKFSEHPIGKAIYDFTKKKGVSFLKVSKFNAKTGFGVEGLIGDKKIYVGKLLSEKDDFFEAKKEKDKGKIIVYIYQNSQLMGAIILSDKIKNEAREVVKELKKENYKTFLITGDNRFTAKAVGEKIGINSENVFYEVLPQDKEKIIRKLRVKIGKNKEEKKIVFIGDGINDAPALTVSDVGIAMGSGTDVAINSGLVVIMNNNLRSIINVINLSKETLLIIKQNFFWAFFYNVILIPLAMMGKINPMLASVAMAFSSVSVVLNSLRLKIKKI